MTRNERFITEVIEGMNVCPFARPGRLAGASARHVLPDVLDREGCLPLTAALAEIASTVGAMEVVQVIYPRAEVAPDDWVRAVKEVTVRVNRATIPSRIAVAGFHPELRFRTNTAAGAIPLFRRSPDPTMQWVSVRALDQLGRGRPVGDVAMPGTFEEAAELRKLAERGPLDDEVAERNRGLLDELGQDALVALFASMRAPGS